MVSRQGETEHHYDERDQYNFNPHRPQQSKLIN